MIERLEGFAQEHPVTTTAVALAAVAGAGIALARRRGDTGEAVQPVDTVGNNFYDYIGDLTEWIEYGFEPGEAPDHFLLGGGISAALMDPDTKFEESDSIDVGGLLVASTDLHKPRVRANGQIADIDDFILTSDPDIRRRVRQNLTPDRAVIDDPNSTPEQIVFEKSKPGNFLKVGICSLTPAEEFEPPKSPLGRLAHTLKKDFVSHRVDDGDGTMSWRIADLVQELPPASFQKWELVLANGKRVPTLHPVVIMACYAARTSHGVRERDVEKLLRMAENIGPRFGVYLQWSDRNRQVELIADDPENPVYGPAVDFVNAKNRLRYEFTKDRMGKGQAGVLAAKIAMHRWADAKLVSLGQGGWLYDNVVSRFSDEDQSAL